jgi:hypothetical protein
MVADHKLGRLARTRLPRPSTAASPNGRYVRVETASSAGLRAASLQQIGQPAWLMASAPDDLAPVQLRDRHRGPVPHPHPGAAARRGRRPQRIRAGQLAQRTRTGVAVRDRGGRAGSYRGNASALRTGLPDAVRVLDAFHVVRLGFAAVDVTMGGIGRAAGLTLLGTAETICGQRG